MGPQDKSRVGEQPCLGSKWLPGAYAIHVLGGRFEYFLFFSAREGEGESEALGGGRGVRFLLKIPQGGGVSRRGRGREGVCGELGNFWGGGG